MAGLFSKRTRSAARTPPDALRYDELPEPLKIQVIHAWTDVLRTFPSVIFRGGEGFYSGIRQRVCEEQGLLHLTGARAAENDVCNFFLQQRDVGKCLDVVEIVFSQLIQFVRADPHVHFDGMSHIRAAAEKVNTRLQEHAIGYEFKDYSFIRIDSGYMHKEVVSQSMRLLDEPYLKGANEEFLKAHDHFRHRRFGECINECLKSFESTMKSICHKRGWSYAQTDTANTLLTTCGKNGLFPPFMQSSLGGLRSVLENVATVRNKLSGHGQGVQDVEITKEVAAFVIHSTGAHILFLASLEKELA